MIVVSFPYLHLSNRPFLHAYIASAKHERVGRIRYQTRDVVVVKNTRDILNATTVFTYSHPRETHFLLSHLKTTFGPIRARAVTLYFIKLHLKTRELREFSKVIQI